MNHFVLAGKYRLRELTVANFAYANAIVVNQKEEVWGK